MNLLDRQDSLNEESSSSMDDLDKDEEDMGDEEGDQVEGELEERFQDKPSNHPYVS